MIITIDGPAGAGKSSAARELARRLGFEVLDTGAMYRAVTLAVIRQGIDPTNAEAMETLLQGLRLQVRDGRVLLNDEDVSEAIRDSRVTQASGVVASSPVVRRHLVDLQRAAAAGRNLVTEGRDQGTVVFPEATCKFFLVADPEERARRRLHDLEARGEHPTLQAVLLAQQERDTRDAARDLGPMVPATDAVVLDSTGLTLEQVVSRMESIVRQRL